MHNCSLVALVPWLPWSKTFIPCWHGVTSQASKEEVQSNEGAITWKRIELIYCKIWLPYVRHVSMWYNLGLAVHLGNANYGIQKFVLENYGLVGNPCIRWTPTNAIWVGEVKHRGSLGTFSKANHTTWVRAWRERGTKGGWTRQPTWQYGRCWQMVKMCKDVVGRNTIGPIMSMCKISGHGRPGKRGGDAIQHGCGAS